MKTLVLGLLMAAFGVAQKAPELLSRPTLDTVVAKVDGKNVTAGDIDHIMQGADARFMQGLKQDPLNALRQYFMMARLAEDGTKAKLDQESPLKEQMAYQRLQVLASAFINKERDYYDVTTEQIEAFYKANVGRYQSSRVKLVYIGFKPAAAPNLSPEDAAKLAFQMAHPPNDRSENDAQALAMEIVQKVRAGEDFCKLAEQHSDDPKTKQDCGTFGLVNATTSLPDNLKKVVLGLKQGEISDPIRDISGFYIVRVDGQVLRPLSDVFEPIVQELRQSHLDAYLKELQAKFQPQVLEQGFFLNPDDYMNRAREPIRK